MSGDVTTDDHEYTSTTDLKPLRRGKVAKLQPDDGDDYVQDDRVEWQWHVVVMHPRRRGERSGAGQNLPKPLQKTSPQIGIRTDFVNRYS